MSERVTADDILSDQLRGVQAMIDRDEPIDLPKAGELWGDPSEAWNCRCFEDDRGRTGNLVTNMFQPLNAEDGDKSISPVEISQLMKQLGYQRLSVIPTAELEELRNELKETRQYMEFQDAKHREMLESLGSWPMSEKGEPQ